MRAILIGFLPIKWAIFGKMSKSGAKGPGNAGLGEDFDFGYPKASFSHYRPAGQNAALNPIRKPKGFRRRRLRGLGASPSSTLSPVIEKLTFGALFNIGMTIKNVSGPSLEK